MAAMPDLTEIIDSGDHQVDVVFAVADHHPRMLRKAHMLSKGLTCVSPLGIREDAIPLGIAQRHMPNRVLNLWSGAHRSPEFFDPVIRHCVPVQVQVATNDDATMMPGVVGINVAMFIGRAWAMQIRPDIAGILSSGDLVDHGNALRTSANCALTSPSTAANSSPDTICPWCMPLVSWFRFDPTRPRSARNRCNSAPPTPSGTAPASSWAWTWCRAQVDNGCPSAAIVQA